MGKGLADDETYKRLKRLIVECEKTLDDENATPASKQAATEILVDIKKTLVAL